MPQTEYIDNIKHVYDLMSDPDVTVESLEIFENSKFILATYTDKNMEYQPHESANVAVACYVTSYARLELYS